MAASAQSLGRIAPGYTPRVQFQRFHDRAHRWAVIVAHRRAGKTVACVMELLTRALATKKQDARYAYIAPYREQAKTAAWNYLKQYGVCATLDPASDLRESDLSVRLHNGAQVRLFGADNPNALRGMYLDGVVMDEFADMRPSLWGEVIRPALSDRGGWAVFIGTPRGTNAFRHLYEEAKLDPTWFYLMLKASETGILPQAELDSARKTMTENQYEQEYECSFSAAVLGAIYAKELNCAEHRITRVPYDGAQLVHTAWDIGIGDSTAIWFAQVIGTEVRLIDYYEANGERAPHYISVMKSKGYSYDTAFVPHDAGHRQITGLSFAEVLQQNGIRTQVLPMLGLEEGINAARMMFSRCVFDAEACRPGLEALRAYRWSQNPRMQTQTGDIAFKPTPVHDWCMAANTQVLTPNGWRNIQDISVHDKVLTPAGPRTVLKSGIVRITDKWTILNGIRCTPEHLFFTSRGLVKAGDVLPTDQLWTRDSWGLKFLAWWCARLSLGLKAAITSATPEGKNGRDPCSYIGWCMRLLAVKSRTAMRCITSITIRSITTLTILRPSQSSPIAVSINRSLDMSAFVGFVGRHSAAIRNSAQGAAANAGVKTMPGSSGSAEPAYDLKVAFDECYFVRGANGLACLVSNSSHGSDAFRYLAQGIRGVDNTTNMGKLPALDWKWKP